MSSSPKVLFGFHAVGVRLKTAPQSVIEIYYEASRRDARMRQFLQRATEFGKNVRQPRPSRRCSARQRGGNCQIA
jgi:hypothetical protein